MFHPLAGGPISGFFTQQSVDNVQCPVDSRRDAGGGNHLSAVDVAFAGYNITLGRGLDSALTVVVRATVGIAFVTAILIVVIALVAILVVTTSISVVVMAFPVFIVPAAFLVIVLTCVVVIFVLAVLVIVRSFVAIAIMTAFTVMVVPVTFFAVAAFLGTLLWVRSVSCIRTTCQSRDTKASKQDHNAQCQ